MNGVGVWLAPQALGAASPSAVRLTAERIEALGYESVWTGEPPAGAPDIFGQLSALLAATSRITVGAGIANIRLRDAKEMGRAAAELAEAYPGRLVLGLGGHAGSAEMRTYLDAMPALPVPRVLAALGPRLLELAAERADGAHPFHMPVAHTTQARKLLGPDRFLLPEQAFTIDPDPEAARAGFRALFAGMSADSPYTRNLRRLGYEESDLSGGRSDRLIDAILAHGSAEAVAERLQEQLAAGANQVLAAPLTMNLEAAVDQLARLAPAVV